VTTNVIYLVTIWVIPVLIAVTFHEAAHGFVAHLLGDDTAWRLGRVSFNPLKHIDPFGTILLPGLLLLLRSPFLFGYAKPVPVKFSRPAQPATRHGAGCRSRAGHEHCARHLCGFGVSHRRLSAGNRRTLAGSELEERIAYQRCPGRVQSVPAITS
jgi:hypothetical protein